MVVIVVLIIDAITTEVALGFSDHILLNMSDLVSKAPFFSLFSPFQCEQLSHLPRSKFPQLIFSLGKDVHYPKCLVIVAGSCFLPSSFCYVSYFSASHPLSWEGVTWPSPVWLWLYGHKLEPTSIREINQSNRSWSFLHNGASFPNYQVIYVVTVYFLGTFSVPNSRLSTGDMKISKTWLRPLRRTDMKGSIRNNRTEVTLLVDNRLGAFRKRWVIVRQVSGEWIEEGCLNLTQQERRLAEHDGLGSQLTILEMKAQAVTLRALGNKNPQSANQTDYRQ